MTNKLAFSGLLLPLASALTFPGATRGPGFVSVPVAAHARDINALQRRATDKTEDIEMPTYGGNSGWVVNITIGTPGQMTSVSLDTGSTELWVDPDCSRAGTNTTTSEDSDVVIVNDPLHDPDACVARGRYDPSKSSTKSQPDMEGRVFGYGDKTSATINYYSDSLDFGGITIKDQIFGVANASNQTGIGIMGMGPPPFGYNNSGSYPLILTNMAKQGAINSPAFSLDLRDLGNTTGSLIFGGIDKGKFGGPLTKIAVEQVTHKVGDQSYADYTTYWLKVNSFTLLAPNNTQSTKSLSIPGGSFVGGLDCGSGAMLVPKGLTSDICKELNGTQNADINACIVDCGVRKLSGGLKVSLNGKDITISYANLLFEYGTGEQATCTIAMQDSPLTSYDNTPMYLLGAPFLRAVYAVFDWGNEAVHIAQAANCGTNIVAIGSGTGAVPGGNGDCPTSLAAGLVLNAKLIAATALFSLLFLW